MANGWLGPNCDVQLALTMLRTSFPFSRIDMRPLRLVLSRALGIAHRTRPEDEATEATLRALFEMRER